MNKRGLCRYFFYLHSMNMMVCFYTIMFFFFFKSDLNRHTNDLLTLSQYIALYLNRNLCIVICIKFLPLDLTTVKIVIFNSAD